MLTAIQFFNNFKTEMEKCDFAVYKRGGSQFTEYMTAVIERILSETFSLKTEREYYRIDVIGWKDRKNEVGQEANTWKMNPHLWDLCAAVEHENNPCDWTDEVIKLTHIRCPLKIIIGYNYCDCREDDARKIEIAVEWMKKTAAFRTHDKEMLLFIFGNASALHSKTGYTSSDYRGYIFDHEHLHDIN